MRVLVTGATGYIGGRLIPRLVAAGHRVWALVRDPRRYEAPVGVGVIEGDLTDDRPLALPQVDAAYYLVHSMLDGPDFAHRDRQAAQKFTRSLTGCDHVIYLGGLMPRGAVASAHLASRAEVGRVLGEAMPQRVTEFRAGPIVGSGSASFEVVRYLSERLPVMVTPRWVTNPVQPIAIRDVLAYLLAALDRGPSGVVDIGADRLTFAQMMQGYASVRGLSRRWVIRTPVLAPGLAARWIGFFTPIPNRLALPLVRGIVKPLLADKARAQQLFPEIEPIPFREAVRLALERTERNMVETRWSGALGDEPGVRFVDREGLLREVRRCTVATGEESVFHVVSSLGGKTGWLAATWAWRVRGWIDKLVGGPGLRRGRRHPSELHEGEAVDFWRVERVEPGRLLRLRAEMRLPGRAWLQWEVTPEPDGSGSRLVQTATFEPRGLPGLAYWYALLPMHALIFGGMLRAIARRAEGSGVRG